MRCFPANAVCGGVDHGTESITLTSSIIKLSNCSGIEHVFIKLGRLLSTKVEDSDSVQYYCTLINNLDLCIN